MPIGVEKVVTTVGTIVARGMVCQCLLVPCGQFLVDVREILDLGIDARMSLISISIRPTGLAAAVVLDGTLQTVDMPLVGFDVASGHFLLALLIHCRCLSLLCVLLHHPPVATPPSCTGLTRSHLDDRRGRGAT
jgi:hypothetical protein